MAKAVTIKVKLVSSADTGFYYVAKKNSRTMTDKLKMKVCCARANPSGWVKCKNGAERLRFCLRNAKSIASENGQTKSCPDPISPQHHYGEHSWPPSSKTF